MKRQWLTEGKLSENMSSDRTKMGFEDTGEWECWAGGTQSGPTDVVGEQ